MARCCARAQSLWRKAAFPAAMPWAPPACVGRGAAVAFMDCSRLQQRRCRRCPGDSPSTTYEGSTSLDDTEWFKGMDIQAGFSRSTFVKERRTQEELVNKYDIGEELGSGATSTVYRAVSQRTGEEVAVKAISKAFVTDAQMLENEIQIHKATDHPNILRLLETFEDKDRLYLVTELCAGADLWKYISANSDEYSVVAMPEEEALHLLQQVVNSVLYLHSRGIVHRDLKPSNFLIAATKEDVVWLPEASKASSSAPSTRKRKILKLADFGVSAYCTEKHRLTKRVGTDGFMAPEILRNQPYNEKADIFSIGCILHMLLTGHPPKVKEDGTFVISKIRLRFVSPEVRSLVHSMMSEQPQDRPSAKEVSRLPILRNSRQQLRAKSARLDAQLLDKMYAYSSFPLLKKAALVAMVSRAESDAEFFPSIEKFLSLDRNTTASISVEDVYEALSEELLNDMQHVVRGVLEEEPVTASAGGPRRSRRRLYRDALVARERFRAELWEDVERLVHKIDASDTGSIGFSEWLAATVDPMWYTDPARISAAFKLFDSDGDGMISEGDLKTVIPNVFKKVTVDAVLAESQLCAKSTSWLTQEHFALLIRTQNLSSWTLTQIASGKRDQ